MLRNECQVSSWASETATQLLLPAWKALAFQKEVQTHTCAKRQTLLCGGRQGCLHVCGALRGVNTEIVMVWTASPQVQVYRKLI